MTELERRDFLLWAAGLAFLAWETRGLASIPPADVKPGPQADGSFVLDPADPPKLDIKPKEEPKGHFVKLGDGTTVLVAQTPDKKAWLAVSAVCTHKQSWICYRPNDRNFQCPSHGSKFTEAGKVTKGPAKTDLAVFDAKEVKGAGGKKLVRVSKR